MLRPTPEDVAAAKAACRAKFGHDRLVGCSLTAPINMLAGVAAFNLAEADAFETARTKSPIDARSALLADRCFWPSPEALERVREEWPAVDVRIEEQFLLAMGYGVEPATAQLLSVMSAPKGFAPPAELAKKVADVLAAENGGKLWSITGKASGLALIVRQPISDVWTAGCLALEEGRKQGGLLRALVPFVQDHLVWSAQPLSMHLDEKPGRALDLMAPWTEMGGAAATGSHSFL